VRGGAPIVLSPDLFNPHRSSSDVPVFPALGFYYGGRRVTLCDVRENYPPVGELPTFELLPGVRVEAVDTGRDGRTVTCAPLRTAAAAAPSCVWVRQRGAAGTPKGPFTAATGGVVEFLVGVAFAGDESFFLGLRTFPLDAAPAASYESPGCFSVRGGCGTLHGGSSEVGAGAVPGRALPPIGCGDVVRLELTPAAGDLRVWINGTFQGVTHRGLFTDRHAQYVPAVFFSPAAPPSVGSVLPSITLLRSEAVAPPPALEL
jgi:hypothetical protein